MNDFDEAGFAWRVVKTSLIFIVVMLAAAVLHFLIKALSQAGLPLPMVWALTLLEYLILTMDLLWLLRFVMLECSIHLKAIWNSGAGFRAALMALLLILILSMAVPAAIAAFDKVLTSHRAVPGTYSGRAPRSPHPNPLAPLPPFPYMPLRPAGLRACGGSG